jgi:putative membrane protein insertion efficiency factor
MVRKTATGVIVWLIEFYQRFISPLKGPTCRYVPTCSQYAKEAFITHGIFKGFFLASWRILRCNPFSAGGYDPVSPRKKTGHDRPRRFGECHT